MRQSTRVSKRSSATLRLGTWWVVSPLLLLLLMFVKGSPVAAAFQVILPPSQRRHTCSVVGGASTATRPRFFHCPIPPTSLHMTSTDSSSNAVEQKDVNDKVITVGAIVKVIVEDGVKAYQVPPKGFGTYSRDTKQFVPAKPGGERGTKNLLIPAGLMGLVTKVYDVEDISAQTPIQVKFVPGQYADEYDPPVAFLMHFHTYELEIVE